MSRRRLFILIFGPIPIVIASLALTRWARSDATPVVARNQIVVDSNTRFEPRSSSETFDDRLEAECLAVAESLGHRLGHRCSWIVRAPFVIAGDFPPAQLDHWYRQAIGPATRALRRSYFDKMPDAPVTLLLFDGQASYENYARTLYGEEGISVFGYYKPAERVLVANLHTGGGTLVHELTHALIDFDFGNVPDWFNEGLASMHEESRVRADESGIDGLINWRLPILQQALEQGRLRPLASLICDDDFRQRDVELNYAQARYLCLWLQRQGLLEAFYREFRDNRVDDPTGSITLQRQFADRSWEQIEIEYRAWVAKQVWPPRSTDEVAEQIVLD